MLVDFGFGDSEFWRNVSIVTARNGHQIQSCGFDQGRTSATQPHFRPPFDSSPLTFCGLSLRPLQRSQSFELLTRLQYLSVNQDHDKNTLWDSVTD
jgi:hypothetical protein